MIYNQNGICTSFEKCAENDGSDRNVRHDPATTAKTSSTLNFGRHEGQSLAVTVFNDPAWFHWALQNRVFLERGGPLLQCEAEAIWLKARNIKLREDEPDNGEPRISISAITNRNLPMFGQFLFEPQENCILKSVLDLGYVCVAQGDKTGNKLLIKAIKRMVFGKSTRVTDEMIEQFFSDPNNFDLPAISSR